MKNQENRMINLRSTPPTQKFFFFFQNTLTSFCHPTQAKHDATNIEHTLLLYI